MSSDSERRRTPGREPERQLCSPGDLGCINNASYTKIVCRGIDLKLLPPVDSPQPPIRIPPGGQCCWCRLRGPGMGAARRGERGIKHESQVVLCRAPRGVGPPPPRTTSPGTRGPDRCATDHGRPAVRQENQISHTRPPRVEGRTSAMTLCAAASEWPGCASSTSNRCQHPNSDWVQIMTGSRAPSTNTQIVAQIEHMFRNSFSRLSRQIPPPCVVGRIINILSARGNMATLIACVSNQRGSCSRLS